MSKIKNIDLQQFKKMFELAINQVANDVVYINNLNVFPVPDGDTGLNLKMSLKKSWDVIETQEIKTISEFATQLSRQTLINARGNSGVIMSRIIKGFLDNLKNVNDVIEIQDLITSFINSSKFAYQSVTQPTEGTMLTVVRYINEHLAKNHDQIQDFDNLLLTVYNSAAQAVIDSPLFLSILRQNNTFDSGAYGLLKFLQGFLLAFEIPIPEVNLFQNLTSSNPQEVVKNKEINFENSSFGYCCEFVLNLNEKIAPHQKNKIAYNYDEINQKLENFGGESIVIVQEDEILKVHVHLLEPYQLLKLGQKYGEFVSIKIENMTHQFKSHVQDLIKDSEDDDFTIQRNSVIYCYLPTNELKDFIKKRYQLDYFWELEKYGEPSKKNLVNEIIKTQAKRIYGLIAEHRHKQKFLASEKLINKKQDLKLFNVKSTVGMLYIISCYSKSKPNG